MSKTVIAELQAKIAELTEKVEGRASTTYAAKMQFAERQRLSAIERGASEAEIAYAASSFRAELVRPLVAS